MLIRLNFPEPEPLSLPHLPRLQPSLERPSRSLSSPPVAATFSWFTSLPRWSTVKRPTGPVDTSELEMANSRVSLVSVSCPCSIIHLFLKSDEWTLIIDLAYEAPEDADLVVDLTKDTVPEIVHGKPQIP
jgi:hypothetical protein